MTSRTRFVLPLLLALSMPSFDAHAGGHPPLGKALTGQSKTDYEAGKALAQTNDFDGALIKFKSAYEASKDPRLLWNMASCEKSLHHYAAAADLLDRYLQEGEGWLTPQDKDDATTVQNAVRSLFGRVALTVEPAGADVALDGKPLGTAPIQNPVRIDLGKHVFHFTKAGYQPLDRNVETTGDEQIQVRVSLDRAASGGTLSVRAGSGDMVTIDGHAEGVGTVEMTLPAGVHAVRVSADGKSPREVAVTLHEGEHKSIDLAAEGGSSHTWLFIGGGAVVAVGAGVAAFLLLRPHTTQQGSATPGSIPPGTVNLP